MTVLICLLVDEWDTFVPSQQFSTISITSFTFELCHTGICTAISVILVVAMGT